jgi:hypothetical protein
MIGLIGALVIILVGFSASARGGRRGVVFHSLYCKCRNCGGTDARVTHSVKCLCGRCW